MMLPEISEIIVNDLEPARSQEAAEVFFGKIDYLPFAQFAP